MSIVSILPVIEASSQSKPAFGARQNSMTRAQVDEKCFHRMVPIPGKAHARKRCDAVWDIEKINDVRKLRALLQA